MTDNHSETAFPVNPNQQRTTRIVQQTPEGDTMERLFQALFYRIAVIYSRAVPKNVRRLGETAILVMAIISLSLLIYLHVVFNHQPTTCLSYLNESWPRHGILRVELFLERPPEDYDLQQSYAKEYHQSFSNFNLSDSSVIDSTIDLTSNKTNLNSSVVDKNDSMIVQNTSALIIDQTADEEEEEFSSDTSFDSLLDLEWIKQLLIDEQTILEYSLEYGFLRLPPATRQRLNITVLYVKLDLSNNSCFGSSFTRFILDQFIGYQEILMASIKQLAEKEPSKGYVRNVMTNDHFRFVSTAQNRRLWTYTVALCIMVIFTVSISMLLRYSHFQIFLFIIDLLRMIEHHTSVVFPAAPLLTVILALIGMEAIMSEFFNDASTAFYIILIVWIADQYDSICCHTPASKHHWVRFFYIYHFAFYAYHSRYNGQYSGLALTTSCCFIVHSMFYFFHHIELPTIEAQLLHIFVDQNLLTRSSSSTQTTTTTTVTTTTTTTTTTTVTENVDQDQTTTDNTL